MAFGQPEQQSQKKKKILFVSTKSVLGGAQRYIIDLVDYLPRDLFDPAVAAGGHGPLSEKIKERNLPYYEVSGLGKSISIIHDFTSFVRLYRLIKKVNPDILHLNSSKASILGAIAGRLAGVPKIVSSTHGWPFLEERPLWQRRILRQIVRFGSLFQDKIICVSDFDYQIGIDAGIANPKKLVPIHNGVDASRHIFLERAVAREKLFAKTHVSPKNYFIIGSIAEYTKNKGLYYLLEAASHMVAYEKNILFLLIGWGEERSFLEREIKKHQLENHVILIDYLPEAFTYLKAFDIFILPSIKEGFAYTLLEASLAELPIITTRVGGNPEIIQNLDNGLLVKPASPEEIIRAISHLERDSAARTEFGFRARKRALKEFSITSMVTETQKVYTS